MAVYGVYINNLDMRMPRIALFATKDIQKGEELTFDYNMTGVVLLLLEKLSKKVKLIIYIAVQVVYNAAEDATAILRFLLGPMPLPHNRSVSMKALARYQIILLGEQRC